MGDSGSGIRDEGFDGRFDDNRDMKSAAAFCVFVLVSLWMGQPGAGITAAQAAPFLGEWTIATASPLGQASYLVTVTRAGDATRATVKSAGQPDIAVTDLRMSGKSLLLSYTQ